MKPTISRLYRTISEAFLTAACGLLLASSATAISPGAKAEIKGRINKRGVDTIVVRDANDMDIAVFAD